ncbi:hypothetical protein I2400191J7_17710 [Ruminococcus bicirculans (ex Wegman et al. 2014)]
MPINSVISEWKNKAISMILSQDNILDLFEKDEEELENIVYSNIYPFLYIPYTQTNVELYLNIEVSVPKVIWGAFKGYPQMIIQIICHQDKMRLNKAGISKTRMDYVSELLGQLFNNSDGWSGNRIQLISDVPDNLSPIYKRRTLIFQGEELTINPCEGN